jgi:hypothetical protein
MKTLIKVGKQHFEGCVPMHDEALNMVIENHKGYIELEQCESIIIIPKDKIKTLVAELLKLDE